MLQRELRRQAQVLIETLRTPPSSLYERNARNVMIDGLGVGLVSGVATFLSVFLARLGASNVLVGLLTSMPAVTGALLSIALGQFLGRQSNIVTWYARSRLWVLSSYALTGLVPFFVGREATIWTIIAIWALATIPQTMVNITFTLVMSAVAGPSKRMALMSRRWTTLGISTSLSVALAGWLLDRIAFPINYQIIFICSFIGGLISYYYSTGIQLPDDRPAEKVIARESRPWRTSITGMLDLFRNNRAFSQFIGSQFMFRCGMSMAIPLFPLYWVRSVGMSDASIGLLNTLQSGVLMIAYTLWILLARRIGAGRVLTISALGLALYPLATAMTGTVWHLLVFAMIAGVFVAGTDLVIFDVVAATAPEHARGTAIGVYHTTNYLAIFIAPLIGTAASSLVGIGTMLMVAAGLRLLGGLLFLALRVGYDITPQSAAVAPSSGGTSRAKAKG